MPICVMPFALCLFPLCFYVLCLFAIGVFAIKLRLDAFTIWKFLFKLQRIAFCHRYTSIVFVTPTFISPVSLSSSQICVLTKLECNAKFGNQSSSSS